MVGLGLQALVKGKAPEKTFLSSIVELKGWVSWGYCSVMFLLIEEGRALNNFQCMLGFCNLFNT